MVAAVVELTKGYMSTCVSAEVHICNSINIFDLCHYGDSSSRIDS